MRVGVGFWRFYWFLSVKGVDVDCGGGGCGVGIFCFCYWESFVLEFVYVGVFRL